MSSSVPPEKLALDARATNREKQIRFRSGYRYVMTTEQVDARPVLASALVTALDHVGIVVLILTLLIEVVSRPPRHDRPARGSQRRPGCSRGDALGARAPVVARRFSDRARRRILRRPPSSLSKRGSGSADGVPVSDLDRPSTRLHDQGVRLLYESPRWVRRIPGSISSIRRTPVASIELVELLGSLSRPRQPEDHHGRLPLPPGRLSRRTGRRCARARRVPVSPIFERRAPADVGRPTTTCAVPVRISAS